MRGILCYSFIVLSAFTICINGHVDSSPPPADADGIHHHRRFLRQSLRLVNTLLKSENGSRRLQLGQSDCTPPQFGCGRGLWNENSCECDCLPVSLFIVAVAFCALCICWFGYHWSLMISHFASAYLFIIFILLPSLKHQDHCLSEIYNSCQPVSMQINNEDDD